MLPDCKVYISTPTPRSDNGKATQSINQSSATIKY